jgi:glutaminyl-tRNA synthetase
MSVKGTIHWVSVEHALPAEVRLYERLFKAENPSTEEGDFKEYINEDSLTIIPNARVERSLAHATIESRYQFLRKGYFCLDNESTPEKMVFNRTVTLKDAWSKTAKKA